MSWSSYSDDEMRVLCGWLAILHRDAFERGLYELGEMYWQSAKRLLEEAAARDGRGMGEASTEEG